MLIPFFKNNRYKVHMSPVGQEAHLSWINCVCVHITVFIPPGVSRPGGTKLCKYGVFEIIFVALK